MSNPKARLSPPRRRRRRRECPFCDIEVPEHHRTAADSVHQWGAARHHGYRGWKTEMLGQPSGKSTDAIVRRWQTIKEAVCASTEATFTKRETAVNARNNDPAVRGALA
jgi:hypothetical protein